MSLQQASTQQRGAGPDDGAAAAGGSGEPRPSRAGREPLSPASDASEHKRRRTSGEVTADLETNASTNAERDAAARTDAAADLEEAIRRSLRDANDTAERPAVGSAPRDGQIRGGGEPPPPRTAPAIDAAALAAAFAAAAASTSSAGHAGSRRTNTADPTSKEDRADEAREDEKAAHERGSGVPVRRPALAGADEAWWRDDDDDDDDDASRIAEKSASGNRVPEISVACPDEESATALLTDLLGCAVVRSDALAKTKTHGTSAGIPIPFAGGPGLTKKVLDAALASRVSPARLRAAGGGDATATLAAVHARAVAKSPDDAIGSSSIGSSSWSSRLASMVRASCAEKLVASLEDDGDDLYFEGGRHRSAFFAVLGSMALRRDPATDADAERLLEDMLDLCAFSEKARRAWLDVPRAAFSNAAKVQIDAVDGLDVPLAALAALFRRPRIVRAFRESLRLEAFEALASSEASSDSPSRLLTCVLGCSKVASAVSGSVLGAFLSRGALPNVLSSPVDGSRRSGPQKNRPLDANGAAACAVFRTTLRGYPEKTPLGDREKLQDVMRLGAARAYDAAHACALRCVKLKKDFSLKENTHTRTNAPSGLETTLAWLAERFSFSFASKFDDVARAAARSRRNRDASSNRVVAVVRECWNRRAAAKKHSCTNEKLSWVCVSSVSVPAVASVVGPSSDDAVSSARPKGGSRRQSCLQFTRNARTPSFSSESFVRKCVSALATIGRANRSASAVTPSRNASGAPRGSRNASPPCVLVKPPRDASASSAVVAAASHARVVSRPDGAFVRV